MLRPIGKQGLIAVIRIYWWRIPAGSYGIPQRLLGKSSGLESIPGPSYWCFGNPRLVCCIVYYDATALFFSCLWILEVMSELNIKDAPPLAPLSERRARAVMKQRAKLAYVSPRLVSITRVSPVGYEEYVPDRSKAVSLQSLRIENGLSVRKLAQLSGISPSTIYRIERGDTWNRPHVAHAVSAALNCSPWQVIEFWDIMESTSLPR